MARSDKQINTDCSIVSILKSYAVRVYKAIVPSKTDESILDTEVNFSDRLVHVNREGFISDSETPESDSHAK